MTKDEYDSKSYDSDVENDENVDEDYVARKRQHHNLLERKRRILLKDGFSQLRDVLPVFRKKKRVRASRLQILKEADNFIRTQKSPQEMCEEIASIDEENRHLVELLADLDYAIATNDVEAIAKMTSKKPPFKPRRYLLENEDTDSEDGESSDNIGESSDNIGDSSDNNGESSDNIGESSDEDGGGVEAIAKMNSMKSPLKRRCNLLENEDTDSEDGGGSPPPVAAPPRRKAKRIRH